MKFFTFLSAALLVSSSCFAHEYQIGAMKVGHPFARPTIAAQSTGAAYMRIENTGDTADKLISANSPDAKAIEIHSMTMEGDVMKMRAEESITIAAKSTVLMQPGKGYHLMLTGLKQALKLGSKIALQLQFEKAGKLDVSVLVEAQNKADAKANAKADAHAH